VSTPSYPKTRTLRNGIDVEVQTYAEARQLLDAMDDLIPQVEEGLLLNPDGKMSGGFRQPNGPYRGDLINKRDPTAPVHPDVKNPKHANFPHYNIKFWTKKKAAIIIVGGQPVVNVHEIEHRIAVSRDHEAVVYWAEVPNLPGWILVIAVWEGWEVSIDLRQSGLDDGGSIVFLSGQLPKEACLATIQQITQNAVLTVVTPGSEEEKDNYASAREVAQWVHGFQGGILLTRFTVSNAFWRDLFDSGH
jgi:hypothetical protein